jgi:hypothetical protein
VRGIGDTNAQASPTEKTCDLLRLTSSTGGNRMTPPYFKQLPPRSKKQMVKLIWDEDYWRHRAEEARRIEEQIRNPECKRIMRKIAQSYDRLALHTKDFQKAAIAVARRHRS